MAKLESEYFSLECHRVPSCIIYKGKPLHIVDAYDEVKYQFISFMDSNSAETFICDLSNISVLDKSMMMDCIFEFNRKIMDMNFKKIYLIPPSFENKAKSTFFEQYIQVSEEFDMLAEFELVSSIEEALQIVREPLLAR